MHPTVEKSRAALRRCMLVALMCLVNVLSAAAGELEDALAAFERGQYSQARPALEKAAKEGRLAAMHVLGWMYGQGLGMDADPKRSMDLFIVRAYYESNPKFDAEAIAWYRRLAARGDAWGQNRYGWALMNARGAPEDVAGATKLFQASAEQGLVLGQVSYAVSLLNGLGIERDRERGLALLHAAVKRGWIDAERILGETHFLGLGVEQNAVEGVRWLRPAAERGHPFARYLMGVAHYKGEGVPQSDTRALEYFRAAAEVGVPEAQFNLGVMHEEGRGVAKDAVLARDFYMQSAAVNFALAQAALGRFFELGIAVKQDLAAALEWYTRAAMQDEPLGQYALGMLHLNGKGVNRDASVAEMWLRKAANRGHPLARQELDRIAPPTASGSAFPDSHDSSLPGASGGGFEGFGSPSIGQALDFASALLGIATGLQGMQNFRNRLNGPPALSFPSLGGAAGGANHAHCAELRRLASQCEASRSNMTSLGPFLGGARTQGSATGGQTPNQAGSFQACANQYNALLAKYRCR